MRLYFLENALAALRWHHWLGLLAGLVAVGALPLQRPPAAGAALGAPAAGVGTGGVDILGYVFG
jgi:hypothetical protein